MKNIKLITSLFILWICSTRLTAQEFITIWKATSYGANPNKITIPAIGSNYNIYWENVEDTSIKGAILGNGSTTINFPVSTDSFTTYRVKIHPGSGIFNRVILGNSNDQNKIIDIEQWGSIEWTSMLAAFSGCYNLKVSAQDVPDLSKVFIMSSMFHGCSNLDSIPNIHLWNTSNIVSMSSLFSGARRFNGYINSWDTKNVTDMSSLFSGAYNFNSPLDNWNTSKVVNMSSMFGGAYKFDQDINSWDTKNVTDMSSVFFGAANFNNPLDNWNTSSVTSMAYMFYEALNFNQDIGNWSTSKVTDMREMFNSARNFNKNIGNWDTENVTIMEQMFYGASNFNQDISSWNLKNATTLRRMFQNATSFNYNISNWNTSNVYTMREMFSNAFSFNQDLSELDISNADDLEGMLDNSGMDCENYDKTLLGWSENIEIPSDIRLGAATLIYWNAKEARQILIDNYGWTITGDFEANCDYPLPLSSLKFDVQNKATHVKANWVSEKNDADIQYYLERSSDGKNWEQITTVQGSNSTYQFNDFNPLPGISFYRLSFVSSETEKGYSDIKMINRNSSGLSSFNIYPNPATDMIYIGSPVPMDITIKSIEGKSLKQASQTTSVSISELPQGIYLIEIRDEGNTILKTHKLIKR